MLKHSFLFAHLDPKELSVIVDAVHLNKVSAGSTIMRQGDRGECLYLVQAGELEVYKSRVRVCLIFLKIGFIQPNDAGLDLVNVITAGQVVGELALLYSSPRAATVIAKTDGLLWKLDRQTFTNVVRNLAIQRREQYISFLASVPLLKHLGDYERSQLVDAISSKQFESGETVVNYGDIGDRFYILSSGRAEAVKDGKIIKEYSPGDYFGELALLRDKPRAATVRIKEGPAVCLSLEREAFNRLLGPLEEIMNENAASYDEFCPTK